MQGIQFLTTFSLLLLLIAFPSVIHATKTIARRVPKTPPASKHTRSKYLVKLKAKAKVAKIASFFTQKAVQKGHKASLKSISSKLGQNMGGDLKKLVDTFDTVITDVYHELQQFSKVFHGLALRISDETLNEFKTKFKDLIEYVEKNGRLYASDVVDKQPASWGLSRVCSKRAVQVNEESNTSSSPFQSNGKDGQGVDVYVLDTGVDASNPDFEGRAKMLKSFVEGEDDKDYEGHGSHCAGTIGSKTYGIARKSSVLGVKVLGKDGSGDFSTIISAIDFVVQKARPNKSVINMSLGGDVSQAVNDAIAAAVNAGVLVVVAAGNESTDACNSSPAASPDALTVGAIDPQDQMADFSNYGRCVKIFAPGVDIVSIGINGKATSVQSGTSMAAPHISGIAAVYMSNKNYGSVKEVIADLQSNAARDLIKNAKGSANLVAYLPGGRSGRSSNAREDAAPDMPQENSGNPPTESADMNTPDNAPAPSDEQALMTQPESNIPFFQTAINNIINSLTKQDKTGMMSVNRKKKTDEERLLTTPLTAAELQAQADEDLLKQAA